jgi:hypothetical protein
MAARGFDEDVEGLGVIASSRKVINISSSNPSYSIP